MRMTEEHTPKKPGRPRSVGAHKAILSSAGRLLARGMSVRALSIEAIAREAGVGKATVYRGWPSGKPAIVLDLLLAAPEVRLPLPPLRTHKDAVAAQLKKLLNILSSVRLAPLLAQLLAEAQGDAKARELLNAHLMGPLRGALTSSVAAGRETGEFAPGLDPDSAVDALVGAPFFRLLSTGTALSDDFCKAWSLAALEFLMHGVPRADGRLL